MPPSTPYAKVLASVNGGATAFGGLTVPGGATIQLSAESTIGWPATPAPKWEIYGFYEATFPLPAGWTDDGSGTYYYLGLTPPAFTLPSAAAGWGKFLLRLTIGGGIGLNSIDTASGLSIVSPSGLTDLAYQEGTQFSNTRSWVADVQANLRALDNARQGGSRSLTVATQATWWIDSVGGNDNNDGTQQTQGAGTAGPLKTLTKWAQLIITAGGIADGVACIVNFVNGTPGSDEPRGTIRIKGRSTLRFNGAPGVTVIRTGTLGTVTTRTGNVPWQGVDGTVDWSTSVTVVTGVNVGIRVRNTTAGGRLNSIYWVAKAPSAGHAVFSSPIAPITYANGAYGISQSTIVVNDTYSVEQLPIINSWGLAFDVNGYNAGITRQEAVQFNDLAFGGNVPAFASNGFNGLAFYNCYMGYFYAQSIGPWSLVNCQTVSLELYGQAQLFAGLNGDGVTILGASAFIDFDAMIQGGTLEVLGNFGSTVAQVQIYDGTAGVVFAPGGSCNFAPLLNATKIIAGTCTGASFIRIPGGTVSSYNTSATGMTGLGSGGASTAVAVGPSVTKSYAQLPAIVSDIASGSGTTFAGLVLAA